MISPALLVIQSGVSESACVRDPLMSSSRMRRAASPRSFVGQRMVHSNSKRRKKSLSFWIEARGRGADTSSLCS